MIIALNVILIALLVVPALYYFVFALAAKIKKANSHSEARCESRFVLLVPAYKSDAFIMPTVMAALNQDYPKELFRVLVISDGMSEITDENLRQKGAEVLRVKFENSTKAASLKSAMEYLGAGAADYAVILDSDNIIGIEFLKAMNCALAGRRVAVQAHRCAKNTDTPVAVADALFEEVNNLVFRDRHNALGLSSALIGSGMAFPYDWFYGAAGSFETAGEDKEMELRLLRDGIFVEYAGDIRVLDEKTRSISNLQKQRKRWLNSQSYLMLRALREFPKAKLKLGFLDKLFQWLFLPRIIILVALPLSALAFLLAGSGYMYVYVSACLLLFTAIALGKPKYLTWKSLVKEIWLLPKMLVLTMRNIFSRKEKKDTYIHTEHL